MEYPTLHVVMADSTSNYPVVSDQMNEKESNSTEPTNYQRPSPPLSVGLQVLALLVPLKQLFQLVQQPYRVTAMTVG